VYSGAGARAGGMAGWKVEVRSSCCGLVRGGEIVLPCLVYRGGRQLFAQ
jgi:hypothetical protein